jgi:hypothetical protein
MPQQISNLPIGAKVKDTNTTYYGQPIIWKVLDHNHPGYPENSTTLITEKIITLKAFDAKEPSNPNTNRQNYGNNRYAHSNIRQWLNKDTSPWYVAQHSYDAPPNNSNVWSNYNEYEAEAGFLSNFSPELKSRLLLTTLTVAKNTVTDGGGSETVQDKVFLLSETEVGLGNENGIAEGTPFSFFSSNTARQAHPTAEAVSNSEYTSTSLDTNQPWYWWLRTPYAGNANSARLVDSSGALNNYNAFYGYYGVRPALNLPSDILVSDEPDSDGAYILIFINTEISIPPGYIGQKTSVDKSNILTYSITTDGTMSTITEKINGTTIATRTNPTSGQQFTVSLTQEQWDAIKYGNGHTLTIEMGSDKWTYTFDKRLNANDDILSAVKGVQDLQDHLNAVKAQLGSAIRANGGTVNDTDAWSAFVSAIANMQSKRWASGTGVTSSTSMTFTFADGSSSSQYPLEVTGLSFRPSIVLIYSTIDTSYVTVLFPENLYTNNSNPIRILLLPYSSLNTSTGTGYSFRLEGNAYVSDGAFRLPYQSANRTVNWIAFE